MTLGDFNGDGQADIAVGVPAIGGRPSWTHVFYGEEGGFFESFPTHRLSGPGGWYSGYGRAVEACDFNGDGLSDLVVGITGLVDTNKEYPPTGQGGFYVYLGRPQGMTDFPNQIRFAETVDPDGNVLAKGLGVGGYLASGDVNGDGACDLVTITAKYPNSSGGTSNALLVYPGTLKTEDAKGGLGSVPAKVYASLGDVSSGLSGIFTVRDVVEDGKAEIIAAFTGGANTAGFISMLAGGDLDLEDGPEIAPLPYTPEAGVAEDSFWSYLHGWGGWAYFGGGGVSTDDVNGDGYIDILVGSSSCPGHH